MIEKPATDEQKVGPAGPTADNSRNSVLVTRTYLEITQLSQLVEGGTPRVPATLERLRPCPEPVWRELYRQIGAPWHWHDRDAWDRERLIAHLERDAVSIYVARADAESFRDRAAGFFELERHADGSVEIAYIGLDRELLGHGLGGWLVASAVRLGFAGGATRVWLHTCTLDAPAALPNYLARGFVATRTENYETTVSSA